MNIGSGCPCKRVALRVNVSLGQVESKEGESVIIGASLTVSEKALEVSLPQLLVATNRMKVLSRAEEMFVIKSVESELSNVQLTKSSLYSQRKLKAGVPVTEGLIRSVSPAHRVRFGNVAVMVGGYWMNN